MARVALVKLFTGLNLGVSQLAGELQRAGHESRIIYFKDFLAVPVEDADRYIVSDYPGVLVGARGREMVWNVYKPFSETEYRLLIDALREFRADLIGLSLSSLTIKPAVEVTARLKEALGVPVVWGGSGPTLEPDGEGTLLRFTHRDLPSAASAESHGHGWDHYMSRLVTAAAGGDPGVDPWLEGGPS